MEKIAGSCRNRGLAEARGEPWLSQQQTVDRRLWETVVGMP